LSQLGVDKQRAVFGGHFITLFINQALTPAITKK
jgi:hypothetical protein